MNRTKKPEKILIFELNWLGDILFSFPFLRAVRKNFPEAYISCVVVPRYTDLLINNPWINDVHVFSDDRGLSAVKEKIEFTNMIRKEKYDICFLLKPSKTKALMSAFAGIRTRIGFEGKKSVINISVDMPKGEVHRADQILSLAGAVGVEEADGSYEYFLNDIDEQKSQDILHSSGGGLRRMVAVNPGGNWDAKRWPLEKHKKLVSKLISEFGDIEVVITGSKKDIKIADEIVSSINNKRCYSIAGRTTLNELASIFKRCELMISADSGPLHLASANNATTIGLFGPTSFKITGPRGKVKSVVIQKDCGCKIPCYEKVCDKGFACMERITVEEVFSISKEILEENK